MKGGRDTDSVLEGERVMRRTTKKGAQVEHLSKKKHFKSGIESKDGGVGVWKGVTGGSRERKEREAGGREHAACLRLMHCDSHLEGFHFP